MSDSAAITLDGVSKKYCRSLKRSMIYGMGDIARDLAGISAHGDVLRAEEYWALRDITLTVVPGECVGVIGPNGAGKSTLLKLVAGIFPPDTGRIRVRPRIGAVLEVGAGFHPLLSGRENVFINGSILGLKNREIHSRFDEIVAFAGLEEFIDSPVKHYSSGMYVRLGFAVAAHLNPDIFLIDEALAVGDTAFRIKCINRIAQMRREGAAILFVSHSEMQVRMAANRILLLNYGNSEVFDRVDEAFLRYQEIVTETNGSRDLADHADYNDEIEIVNFSIESHIHNKNLVSGDPVRARFRLEVQTPVTAAYLVIRIWNTDGQLAAVVDSRDEGRIFDLSTGTTDLIIEIAGLPLVPGQYRLAGGLRSDMRIIGWSTRLAWMEIKPRTGSVSQEGILALSATYTIDTGKRNGNAA